MLIDTKLVIVNKNVTIIVYDIVLRIITVLVSVTPVIFRKSSIHALISCIVGAWMITQMSYCPVIS
jgi:hypothetical protein